MVGGQWEKMGRVGGQERVRTKIGMKNEKRSFKKLKGKKYTEIIS